MAPFLSTGAALLALVSYVSAHGFVSSIQAGGRTYPGNDPNNFNAQSPGWRATNTDNGFVSPSAYGSSDIACHRGGSPSAVHATLTAGSQVRLTWNTWPESHKGPVIDYIASCNGDCSRVSPGSLSFAKIAQSGLISGSNPGTWASDNLIRNGNSWTVTIPSNLAPGDYVLRHEIIALHAAGSQNGAQNYPQCINLRVTSGGGSRPSGTSATSLYSPTNPGILFNLYTSFSSYPIPGPAVWRG
jgi:hypothetical protein